MSIKVDSSAHIKTITDSILGNKATLLIGSGMSTISGAPDGRTLVSMLKRDFPSVDQENNNLIDLFQELIDDPDCGPERLNEYLRNTFLKLIPSEVHKEITKYPWNSIFTTNYDRLVEDAYGNIGLATKLRRIIEFDYDINLRDNTKVFLFKLMGSVDIPLGQEGDMVLSRKQYHENLINRGRYLQQLRDSLLDSTLIIIGYSGKDRLLFDIIEKTMENRSIDKIPFSFMVVKQENLSSKDYSLLTSKKIVPVHLSIENLFENLKKASQVNHGIAPSPSYHTITVETTKIPIDETDFNSFSEDFEILTDEATRQAKADKTLFFKAMTKSWAPFKEDLDFKRDVYALLKKRALNELVKNDPKDNLVLTLMGPPGSGKSISLRRLAYDVYLNGTPVIVLNEHTTKLDYRLIDKFLLQINRKFDEINGSERRKTIKPLIIIDDAPSLLFDPTRISQSLKSSSRSALIVVAGRTAEWGESWYTGKSPALQNNLFVQRDLMSENEINSFAKYLSEKLDIHYSINDIKEKSQSSFFGSMYTAIDTTHRPLDEIIKGLYRDLPSDSKRAYEVVCCLHQFGITMPQLLLARCLDCDSITQLFEILTPQTSDTIVEDEDQFGNIFYRSQHRIVARKTMEFFLGDPAIQQSIIENILDKINYNVKTERGLVERLLVSDIKKIDLSYSQKQKLYRKATEKQEIRLVVHHWGILEMDNNNMEEARKLLERAMNIKEPIGAFKSESDRNIFTSLGVLHSRLAISEYKTDPSTAAKNLELAESYFNAAKTSGVWGEHPYGAHASMLVDIASLESTDIEKMNFYLSGALQIIENAKKRGLAKKEGTYLNEVELKIWAAITNEEQSEEKIFNSIEIIAEKRNSARGYYLYAKYLRRYKRSQADLKRAYDILSEGLKRFPDDEECASLRIEYFMELYPKDKKQLYALLSTYAEQTAYPQISLLYEAATIAIQMGYYTIGLKWYKKLERLTKNEENRFVVNRYLYDESGSVRLLKGQITRIIDQYNGEIYCESLPDYPEPIRFRPIGLPVGERDTVVFNLGLPLVGPVATNIKRI